MQNKNMGNLIVLYGINNLGKSTQAKLLVEKMNESGHKAKYLKYPVYDLTPSGPILNNYLREGNTNNLSPREAQIIYVLNRTQYEPILKQKLAQGINIIAEDYIGTGIAWGMGAGVDKKFLIDLNKHLPKESLVFYFSGNRFVEATEKNHRHETNNELLEKVKLAHDELAQDYNWKIINANLSIKNIHEKLWQITQDIL